MTRTLRRLAPPAPLAMLLPVVLLFSVAWALFNPAWHAPDEISHFTYAQTLAEQQRFPGIEGRPSHSTELERAAGSTNTQPVIFHLTAQPEASRPRERDWAQGDPPRDDGGGPSQASGYPPLYYGYEAAAYTVASGGDIFTRLGVMRIASALWLLVATIAAWLLAGELFARTVPRLVTAATVGLWPMMTFVSASINPDAALFALWTLAIWMGVRVARRGITPARGALLGAFVGAAVITKAATLVLIPPVLVLATWAAWRERGDGWGRPALSAALTALLIAVPSVAWSVVTGATERAGYATVGELGTTGQEGLNVRELASYLWQFYLPRLSFMQEVDHHVPVIGELPLFNTWVGTGSATFGWVNVWFPKWVYLIVAGVLAVVGLLLVAAVVRWWSGGRAGWRRQAPAALFLVAVAGALVAGVHWTDYRFYDEEKGLFAQGRYLLPAAGFWAVAVAWALDSLPRRAASIAAGAWLAGLVVFQIASLGLILSRFYA